MGHLGKRMCVKCIESKAIEEMSVNLAIYYKISLLNKPMPFTASIVNHQMVPTLIPLIQVGRTMSISPTKIPILFLTTLHKKSLTLPVEDLNGAFHSNSNKDE